MEDPTSRSSNAGLVQRACHPKKRKRTTCYLLKQVILTKKFCVAIAISSIVFIWLTALVPLLISIPLTLTAVSANGTSSTGRTTLGQRLPPLNVTNASNFTIERIDCAKLFVHSSADNVCYPPCNWDAQGGSYALAQRILFSTISLAGIFLNLGTLLGWLFTHFLNPSTCQLTREFQLPRASLFTVFICNAGLLSTYAIVDLTKRSVLFCSRTPEGEEYLPAHLTLSYDLPRSNKIAMNVLGVLNYFFFLATLIWLKNAFINMALVVFFPLHINQALRTRILIFTGQCVYGFGIPIILLFFIIGANPQSPFASSYILHEILIFTNWTYIFFYKWPYFIIAGVISTIMILILTKLRFVTLESKSLGRSVKFSEIEKRLFAYALLFALILLIIGSGLVGFYLISFYYFKIIEDYILCVTVNSPLYILPPNTNSTATNSTVAYRDNSFGDLTACNVLLDTANGTLPPISSFLFSLCTRLVWFLPFLVLFPVCDCDCKRRKGK